MFIGRAESETPIHCPPDAKSWLIRKDPDAGKDWRQEKKGTTGDEMLVWYHWFNGHEFKQTPGDSEGSDQIRSVAQLCPTLWDPINCSTPGLPVHHLLPEFIQTHVHQVSDAIQPSYPLSSPSPPAFNLSQQQSLFQWVSPSHHVAKALEFHLQYHSFQWIFRTDFPLGLTDWISLLFKGLSRVFSNTTIRKHWFFSTHLSLCSSSHIHTWLLEKP